MRHRPAPLSGLFLTLAAAVTPAAAAPYVRAWEFDDAAGLHFDHAAIEVADGAARLRSGTLPTGTALMLNVLGSPQSARVPDAQQAGLGLDTDSFLFVAWVRPRNAGVTHAILEKRQAVGASYVGLFLQLEKVELGHRLRAQLETASSRVEILTEALVRDTGWHAVGLAVDRSAARAQFYLDGRPVGGPKSIGALAGSLANGGDFVLGADGTGARLVGDLDEAYYWRWSGALPADTAARVAGHFDGSVTPDAALVSAWRFDAGDGRDDVGANGLVLANSPSFVTAGIQRYPDDAPYLESDCVPGGGVDIYSADHVLTGPPDQAEVRYQLSADGTTWWYHDATAGWTAASAASVAQSSLLYPLRENLPTAPLGSGLLCFRAFLVSNGLLETGLDRFATVERPAGLALVAEPAAGRPEPGAFHVIFETDYPADAFVEYRAAAAGPAAAWLATPVQAGATVFGVDVEGLDPGSAYEYRARFRPRGGDGPFAASRSAVLPVAPPAGSVADIEFAVWGDTRPNLPEPTQPLAFYRLAERLAGERPVFHVAVGDSVNLSNAGTFGQETAIEFYEGWRDAYDVTGGTGYMFFALGNHDEGLPEPQDGLAATARLRSTVQPTDGDALQRYYSWRWGDALFVVLNGSSATPTTSQLGWLYQKIREPARWKFVFNHYPLFNSDRGIGDLVIRNDMHANFLAQGVNVVFQAHDHWYADTEVNGIHYTTTGGGGSPLRPGEPAFNPIVDYHYLRVRLAQYAATVRAIKVNEDGSAGPQLARYCVRAADAPWDNADGDDETDVCDEDDDGDGVPDTADTCRLVANSDQRDTNGDGYGNACDADLDDNGIVNFADLALFRQRFGTADADADFDGSGGIVNFADLAIFRRLFGQPPGPAAAVP